MLAKNLIEIKTINKKMINNINQKLKDRAKTYKKST